MSTDKVVSYEDPMEFDYDELSVADSLSPGADLDAELQALANSIQAQRGGGLAAIQGRAKAYVDHSNVVGPVAAASAITVDAARAWVAADVDDFRSLVSEREIQAASTEILGNVGRVSSYGEILKSREPEISLTVKSAAQSAAGESAIQARFLTEGVPADKAALCTRANEDALDVLLGVDETLKGESVVKRMLTSDDYKAEFYRTVAEFVELNQDGPFYDAPRFWAAQRLLEISDRKLHLRNGGTPELADWKILLEEVLLRHRRPLAGAEFKEVVAALEAAARGAGARRDEVTDVVELLAKVHGQGGEVVFQDQDLRRAYVAGLQPKPSLPPAARQEGAPLPTAQRQIAAARI